MEIILIVYLVVSIALIGIILLQQGKGAEMGASFGAGGANTVFGAAGSGNVLTKATTILTILFFAIALTISYLNSEPTVSTDSVIDETSEVAPADVPDLNAQLPTTQADDMANQVAPAIDAEAQKAAAALTEKAEEIAPGEETPAEETETENK